MAATGGLDLLLVLLPTGQFRPAGKDPITGIRSTNRITDYRHPLVLVDTRCAPHTPEPTEPTELT